MVLWILLREPIPPLVQIIVQTADGTSAVWESTSGITPGYFCPSYDDQIYSNDGSFSSKQC